MLKSCKYCGRVHDSRYDCGKRPRFARARRSAEHEFRSKKIWTDKSLDIRTRDHFCCQLCARDIMRPPALPLINVEDVQVHHITPVAEDPDMALDELNLVTVCRYHHELCEQGKISRDELRRIAWEQEQAWHSGAAASGAPGYPRG